MHRPCKVCKILLAYSRTVKIAPASLRPLIRHKIHQQHLSMNEIRKQVKEFTLSTQLDLEQERSKSQTRAMVAEEQLKQMQVYMAQSALQYQQEIMRLRQLLAQHENNASQPT